MSETTCRDFEQILSQPVLAYEEGLRFFQGVGLMNATLRRLARDLEACGIPYCVIGAVALNQHGYQRFTHDIDLLMTCEGLQKFTEELLGRGYRLAFDGATRTFRAAPENVPIKVHTADQFPGDGKPKPVVFTDPVDCSVEIDGIQTVTLEKLIELKIASGMTGLGRRRDLADVQELIRARALDSSLADRLDPSVRPLYLELHSELEAASVQHAEPDREPRRPP